MRHHSVFELFAPKSASPGSGTSWLLDAAGRKVLDLKPGTNDVRALAPGVYFVRQASGAKGEASSVTKVVTTE